MSGVNFTAGLPVIRTSPDHGTAYNLAGKGEAEPQSMLHAIYAAIDILRLRTESEKLEANQLIVEIKEDKREHKVERFVPQD